MLPIGEDWKRAVFVIGILLCAFHPKLKLEVCCAFFIFFIFYFWEMAAWCVMKNFRFIRFYVVFRRKINSNFP